MYMSHLKILITSPFFCGCLQGIRNHLLLCQQLDMNFKPGLKKLKIQACVDHQQTNESNLVIQEQNLEQWYTKLHKCTSLSNIIVLGKIKFIAELTWSLVSYNSLHT